MLYVRFDDPHNCGGSGILCCGKLTRKLLDSQLETFLCPTLGEDEDPCGPCRVMYWKVAFRMALVRNSVLTPWLAL
jgi:hypothetical protein